MPSIAKPFMVGHLVFCLMEASPERYWFGDRMSGWNRAGTVELNHGWLIARFDDAPSAFLKVAHGTPQTRAFPSNDARNQYLELVNAAFAAVSGQR
jgi:hypothetical protein